MIRESSDSDAPRGTRAPEKQTQHRSNQQEHPVALTSEPGVPDLIPVRMLNEFSYCPRLGYLEWVDGEWADNLETMQGAFGHRRVDRPDQQPIPPATTKNRDQKGTLTSQDGAGHSRDSTIHTRSLMLSAPDEGLLAKLDLLEVNGMNATPVDYKRGKAPKIPEGAYEPERVQLCAQALSLRDPAIYRRRTSLFDNEL